MDFRELGGAAATPQLQASADAGASIATDERRLTALEWSVVAIARKDRQDSLRRPSRLSTALRALFNQPNPRLADERLEALRRMAVLTWRHDAAVAQREMRAFLAAGFSPGQYEVMAGSIAFAKASASQWRNARRLQRGRSA